MTKTSPERDGRETEKGPAPTPVANEAPVAQNPPEKPAKATKISVRVVGECGEQKLFVYAIGEDGSLVAGAKGILLDGDIPSTFTTDDSGMFVYPTNFIGARTFRVRIGENDQNNQQRAWKGVLQGN